MEKLISNLLPNSERFTEMPYGALAYIFLFAAFANTFIYHLVQPYEVVGSVLAMFMFMCLTAGREQLKTKFFGPEVERTEAVIFQIVNYDTTTQHMRRLAGLCFFFACLALLRQISLEYAT